MKKFRHFCYFSLLSRSCTFFLVWGLGSGVAVFAQEEPVPAGSVLPQVQSLDEADTSEVSSSTKRKRSSFRKEIDGTEAPNRFNAETVIKSKYQRNGRSLEVDPD